MTRFASAAPAAALAALALAPAAHARPADVSIVSAVQLSATVTNTVRVSTTPTAPTPIFINETMFAGTSTASNSASYTVPAGKDLIITHVSGDFAKTFSDNTALRPRFHILLVDGSLALYAPMVSDNQSFYSFVEDYTTVARSSLGLTSGRDDTTGTAFARFVVQGYLVTEGSSAAAATATSGQPPAGTGTPETMPTP